MNMVTASQEQQIFKFEVNENIEEQLTSQNNGNTLSAVSAEAQLYHVVADQGHGMANFLDQRNLASVGFHSYPHRAVFHLVYLFGTETILDPLEHLTRILPLPNKPTTK
jgi:hypothetical protein